MMNLKDDKSADPPSAEHSPPAKTLETMMKMGVRVEHPLHVHMRAAVPTRDSHKCEIIVNPSHNALLRSALIRMDN